MVSSIQPIQIPPSQPNGNGKAGQLRQGNFGARNKTKASQLCEMQQVLRAIVLNKDTKPGDAAACSRAYDVLEDRLRILKGKFKPGDVRAADLDPVRLAWTVKRFSLANRKTLRGLPGMQSAIAIEAEVVEKKTIAPPAPTGLDRLPGDVTP
jgi:hypothetical protein